MSIARTMLHGLCTAVASWAGVVGYRVNPNFSVEAQYLHLGDTQYTAGIDLTAAGVTFPSFSLFPF